MANESDAGRAFFYFLYGGIVTVYKDNGNVATIDSGLFLDDDDIPITECRFHRGPFDLERKIIASSGHFRSDFLIIKNLLDGINRNTSDDTTQNRNFNAFFSGICFHYVITQKIINGHIKNDC